MKYIESQSDGETWRFLAGIVVFLGIVGYFSLWQVRYIKLIQKLYPEKKGDPTSLKFQEQWLASCDEGQKLITYQAAYKAFQNTNAACIILWILAFVGMFILKTGVYPILCICIIWLINNVSYMLRAAKLERRK